MGTTQPLQNNSSGSRLLQLESLRGIMSVWVVVAHVLSHSGYIDKSQLHPALQILRSGGYAVDVFVILSGFVICLLLDTKRENYIAFITRRFFRLWPLFIVLFFVSIPLSHWIPENTQSYVGLNAPEDTAFRVTNYHSWWEHLKLNIATHVVMLHGLVPEAVAPGTPAGFLPPAWSISLEWQFYLVVPFLFYGAQRLARSGRWSLLALTGLALMLLSIGLSVAYPNVIYGAFLPDHAQYFLLGSLSYVAYRRARNSEHASFLVAAAMATALSLIYFKTMSVLPLMIWLPVWALCIAPPKHRLAHTLSRLMENPVLMYIGRISYSIYLAHIPVLIVLMKLFSPHFEGSTDRIRVLTVLMPATLLGTLLVAAILYRWIEVPGIALGRKLTKRPQAASVDSAA